MFQIKHWIYYPNKKADIDKFFNEVNEFLEIHDVRAEDISISESSDYIFVYVVYKTVKSKKRK